jgi:hypothetical protein
VDGPQLRPEFGQPIEPQGIRTIRQGSLRIFVNFHEDAIHSRCATRAGIRKNMGPGEISVI